MILMQVFLFTQRKKLQTLDIDYVVESLTDRYGKNQSSDGPIYFLETCYLKQPKKIHIN